MIPPRRSLEVITGKGQRGRFIVQVKDQSNKLRHSEDRFISNKDQ